MALPKISDARELDDQALETAIVDTRRRLFTLRFQQATRQLEGGLHQFKHERHRLGQLMTVLRERQLTAAAMDAVEQPLAKADSTPSPVATITDDTNPTSASEEE